MLRRILTLAWLFSCLAAFVTPAFAQSPPGAPSALTANPGNGLINLSWNASSGGATSYNLYRGISAGGEGTTPILTGITGTTCADFGLTNGTTYYYKVTGVNSAGESTKSNEAHAAPSNNGGPAAITNGWLVEGNGHIALFWMAASGASSYNIYRSVGGAITRIQQNVTATTTLFGGLSVFEAYDPSLSNGVMYTYYVTSVSSSGEGPASFAIPAIPASVATPTAPQYLSADVGNPGASIRFNQSTSGANTYDLYRSTSSGSETASASVVNLTNTSGPNRGSISDTTPISGTKYYYEIVSVATPVTLPPNAPSGISYYAEGPASSEVSFKLGGSPPSSAPPNLTATSKNFASAVSWGTVTGAVSYNLYYYTNAPTFTLSQNVILATNSLSTTISNIPYMGSSSSLQVAVAAVNGDGEGPLSSQVSATLLGYGLQSAPASTTVARGQHSSVTITMPAANGFTGPVALSVSGAPTGVTAWLDSSLPTVVLSDALGNGTGNGVFPTNDSEGSTLFLNIGSNATPGTYTLTITGNATAAAGASYNFTQIITVTLNIT